MISTARHACVHTLYERIAESVVCAILVDGVVGNSVVHVL